MRCRPPTNLCSGVRGIAKQIPELLVIMVFAFLFLATVGFISVARSSVAVLCWTYAFLLRPGKDLKTRYGAWAVVTGATDGIGKALSLELARRGLNLVLVGRNPNKLQSVADAITQECTTAEIRSVVFDLTGDIKDGIRRLREAIEGLDVGVLVNNAGASNRHAMFFDEVEDEKWMNIIKLNVVALTEVTHAVLPGMVERRKGSVVNIGSGSAVVLPSYPLFSVYTGTKAYVDQFSRSLHIEYKSSGIDVQCQHPLYVATRMVSKVAKVKWYNPFVASAADYAQASLHWIGYESRCVPYLPHFLQWCFTSLVPEFICDHIFLLTNISQRKALRRRSS